MNDKNLNASLNASSSIETGMNDLPCRIKRVRNEFMKVSRDKMATLIGFARTTIQQYENGAREPSLIFLIKLSELAKVNLEWLITGKGDEVNSKALIMNIENFKEHEITPSGISNLPNRIKSIRKDVFKTSRVDFAKLLGFSGSTVQHYENGTREASVAFLIKLAECAGVHIEWLITGREPKLTKDRSNDGFTDKADQYVYVAFTETRKPVGDSLVQQERLAFRLDWVNRKGLKREKLSISKVKGNNMTPTLNDGDTVLIEVYFHKDQNNQIKPGLSTSIPVYDNLEIGLYHTNYYGGTIMKLEKDCNGGINLYSENPDYPTINMPKDKLDLSKILGKVVWFCRSL